MDPTTPPPPPETIDQKLARLEREKTERDQIEVNKAKERHIQALELEARFSKELGPRGVAFNLLETSKGPIVVKKGEAILYKRIRTAIEGDKAPTIEELAAFVTPCVAFPTPAEFNALTAEHPGLFAQLIGPIADLYNAEEVKIRGK